MKVYLNRLFWDTNDRSIGLIDHLERTILLHAAKSDLWTLFEITPV